MIPQTQKEYERLFHQNQRISGRGFETTVHMPCPFCAAPDWNVYRVVDSRTALAGRRTCATCGRTAEGIITVCHDETTFEMVLVSGDDPPEWIPMRRAGA